MSKQYLTLHTLDAAHPTDIFSLTTTPYHILSASGSSSILIHSTTQHTPDNPDFPLLQTLKGAHPLGCHHIATSAHLDNLKLVSTGFGGECKVWKYTEVEGTRKGQGEWTLEGEVKDTGNEGKGKKVRAGEIWAIALSEDGRYLACTSYDGRINVFDLSTQQDTGYAKIRSYETKGSFGLAIALSGNGNYTASGHENGGVYIFNNDSGRLLHSLSGLVKPVRQVKFSPASTLLAAAGDARVIGVYDTKSGEQVMSFSGHGGWVMGLDWNGTGEYLLSCGYDGKAKIWSVDSRTCVATHSETDKTLWAVKWLPKTSRSEMFAVAGANKSISIYREASGS